MEKVPSIFYTSNRNEYQCKKPCIQRSFCHGLCEFSAFVYILRYTLHKNGWLCAPICKSFLCSKHVEVVQRFSAVLQRFSSILRVFRWQHFIMKRGSYIWWGNVNGHCFKRWTYTLLWLFRLKFLGFCLL